MTMICIVLVENVGYQKQHCFVASLDKTRDVDGILEIDCYYVFSSTYLKD